MPLWTVGLNGYGARHCIILAGALFVMFLGVGCASYEKPVYLLLEGKLSNYSEATHKDVDVDFSIIVLSEDVQISYSGDRVFLPEGALIALPLPEEMHVRWFRDFYGKFAKVRCEVLPGHYMPEVIASCYARQIMVDA
jgi:hypothetical protein